MVAMHSYHVRDVFGPVAVVSPGWVVGEDRREKVAKSSGRQIAGKTVHAVFRNCFLPRFDDGARKGCWIQNENVGKRASGKDEQPEALPTSTDLRLGIRRHCGKL